MESIKTALETVKYEVHGGFQSPTQPPTLRKTKNLQRVNPNIRQKFK